MSDGLSIAASGMAAQSNRMRMLAENIANADTPGYRRKTASFEAAMRDDAGVVSMGPVTLDRRDPPLVFDPSHPMADAQGYYEGSTVDLIVEIADAREARRSYDANMAMFDQTRELTRSLFELMRR